MYSVSEEYKTQIKQPLRNLSHVRIALSVVDPQAAGDAISSDDGAVYWSKSEDVFKSYDVVENYMTLEHNRFVLDGTGLLPLQPTEGPFTYQGYVGDKISEDDGVFLAPNTLVIDFQTTYFTFIGFTFSFDALSGDYPAQLQIKAFEDAVEVYSETKPANAVEDWVWEESIPLCNRLEITVLQSVVPFRRTRITSLVFGVRKVFTDDVVETFSWNREVDLISSALAKNEFDFTFVDEAFDYNPENPEGIYQYLESQQPIEFELGYELNDGSIEWVPGGTTFTTGEVTVETAVALPRVTVKSVSTLNYLLKEYTEGVYYPAGITLYDLAEDVLEFCNIPLNAVQQPRWTLDPILATYTTKMPLPVKPARECLQLIANAAMCVLTDDKLGNVVIAPAVTAPTGFKFSLSDIKGPPKVSKIPVLQGVDTYLNIINLPASAATIGTYDIAGASSSTYVLTYPSAYNVSASPGGGLTINGVPQYFADRCIINLTGTGTLTLAGYPLTIVKQLVSAEVNLTGDRCLVENSLITSGVHAQAYAEWVAEYLNRRGLYEVEDRGFPELDVGDVLLLDTLLTEDMPSTLVSSKIMYNGALSGVSKLLEDGGGG